MMKITRRSCIAAFAGILTMAALTFVNSRPVLAQSQAMKGDAAQLARDIHTGLERSTLTPQQKEEFRNDFRDLRRARQNHEPLAELRAARKIHTTLDSGAFKPQDQQKIKQDMQKIREAHQHHHGVGM